MFKAFKLIWQCDPKGFCLKLFYTLCTSLLPLLNLYVLKLLVDSAMQMAEEGMTSLSGTRLLYYVLAFCAVTLLGRLFSALASVNNDVLIQRMIDHINERIQNQSARLDIAFFDNPDFHDTLHRAQQEAAFRPVRILENAVSLFGAAISLVGVMAIIVASSWQVVAVMVCAALPTFAIQLYRARRIYRFRRETTQLARRSNYYSTLLTGRNYAKEMRLFGLADYFRQRYVEVRRQLVGSLLTISRRMAWLEILAAVIEVAALFFILLMLLHPIVAGVLTVGTFVMLFEAFRRGQGYLSSLVSAVSGLYEHKLFISNLFEFLSLEPAIVSPADPVPFPKEVENIEFDDVTFAYPSMDRPVLSHCTLQARRGEVTRLEGPNGMGKTTMLKLLMRLYDPQQGVIRINGIDIRHFSVNELRNNISALFQDFVQFYLTAADNVMLSDIHKARDARRLAEALQLSDAQAVVDNLSNGVDTPLGRLFDGGEELSQGQWQRLALARSIYAQTPILILDEPTAWLDPTARNHFLDSLEQLKNNKIILMATHNQ
ncbi:MAG: ABC transporter ATP-binding protein/permease [Bacteroidales bacterium]|nr:ABC transporter ATP-binding protein/permease [Bacteroidales bacterium]